MSPAARLGAADAAAFENAIAAGGVVVFPADTVYGLACDPENAAAVRRLYRLKGRPARKPAAVMAFDVDAALAAVPELGARTSQALRALLPGAITALLPNPTGRYPLACAGDPATLGLRVPALPGSLRALARVRAIVLQSSANLAGGSDARRLDEVPRALRDGADLVLDGGELPGTPSTVVDLRALETIDSWRIVRAGAVAEAELERRLDPGAGGGR